MITRDEALLAVRAFLTAIVSAAAIVFLPNAFGEIRDHSASFIAAATDASDDDAAPRGASSQSVRVIDGDTIADRATGTRYRLANIDTPETGAVNGARGSAGWASRRRPRRGR